MSARSARNLFLTTDESWGVERFMFPVAVRIFTRAAAPLNLCGSPNLGADEKIFDAVGF
jgi:hypothetical protein